MESLSEGITPVRGIRVPHDLWHQFAEVAKYNGSSVSGSVRKFMQGEVNRYLSSQRPDDVWCSDCEEFHRDNGGRLVGCEKPFVRCGRCRVWHAEDDCARFGNG